MYMYIHVCISLFIFLVGNYEFHTIDIDGKKIKLEIWDTSGLEQFRTMVTTTLLCCIDFMVSWGCGEGVVRFVILI